MSFLSPLLPFPISYEEWKDNNYISEQGNWLTNIWNGTKNIAKKCGNVIVDSFNAVKDFITPENKRETIARTETGAYDQKKVAETVGKGLDPNETCLLATWMSIQREEGLAESKIIKIVQDNIPTLIANSGDINGKLLDQNKLNKLFAEANGRTDGKYLQEAWPGGEQLKYDKAEDFYNSKHPYAKVCYSYTDSDNILHTHWTYVSNSTNKECDPWSGGITNTSSNKTYWQKAKKTYYPLGYYK